jgi:penicillin-insensitive murein DD-endopeptidase
VRAAPRLGPGLRRASEKLRRFLGAVDMMEKGAKNILVDAVAIHHGMHRRIRQYLVEGGFAIKPVHGILPLPSAPYVSVSIGRCGGAARKDRRVNIGNTAITNCYIAAFLLILTLGAPGRATAAEQKVLPWAAVHGASAGPASAIGGPANGCLAGAAVLPADGVGYQAIRLARRRNFGHPDTIAFVARLGRAAEAAGLAPFYVGDMAQPRGGPMEFGHGAHQNGLDVDIWFNLDPKPVLPPMARDDVPLPSMLLPGMHAIDPARFGTRQVTLLRLAAADPRVDRIFVNPVIKQALCQGIAGATAAGSAWLHKLRPWPGHDEHFHVRLACPPGATACVGQSPVPPGDGCDATLAWWFEKHEPTTKPAAPKPPRPRLPTACAALLSAG